MVQVKFYLYHQVLIKVGLAVLTGSGVYIGSFNKKGYNTSDCMHPKESFDINMFWYRFWLLLRLPVLILVFKAYFLLMTVYFYN